MITRKGDGKYAGLLPGLALAAAWPAIWLAWIPLSHAAHDTRRPLRPVPPKVSYVWSGPETEDLSTSPMLIIRPYDAGAPTIRDDKPDVAPLAIAHLGAVRLSELTAVNLPQTPKVSFQDLQARPGSAQNGYEPVLVEQPLYGRAVLPKPKATVQISEPLRECGFEPGALLQDCMAAVSNRCSVSAYVETDALGLVQRVFIETPSDNPRLNALFVRSLMQGRALKPGTACNGLVSIAFSGARP